MGSNVERTGKRDMRLSEHLRSYGNCFITDLDGLLLGFDYKTPVGLFEMKHMDLVKVIPESERYHVQAQNTLATNSRIGFYFTVYNPDAWIFNIKPMNEFAIVDMGSRKPVVMSDADFYRYQCKLRSKAPAKDFSENKNWIHPEMKAYIEDQE